MSSKTTTENKPPKWATPLFEQSAAEAQKLYDSGSGGNVYQGSTVAPLSSNTLSGMSKLTNAGNAWDTSQTRDIFGNVRTRSYNDPYQSKLQTAGQGMVDTANQGAVGTGDYNTLMSQADNPTAAKKYLTATARGDYLNGEGNPFYRQRLEQEIGDANSKIMSQFAGSGRYGSGANQSTIAKNTGNMLMQGLESDWNRERANQLAAVGMMDSANSASLQNQLGILNSRSGIDAANVDRVLGAQNANLGAINSAAGLRQSNLDRALSATGAQANLDQQNFQNQLTGANAVLQAGQIRDKQNQAERADDVAKWYANDNKDWNRLGMLQTAAAGAAGNYGTQATTQRNPFNPLQPLGLLAGAK